MGKKQLKIQGKTVTIKPTELLEGKLSCSISSQEYLILNILLKFRGSSVSRETLYYALWGRSAPDSRVVDMHVVQLRRKISLLTGTAADEVIITLRGKGYCLPAQDRNPDCE